MKESRTKSVLLVLVMAVVALYSHAAVSRGHPVSSKDLKKLIKILDTGSGYKTRVQAARALGMLRTTEAVPHLLKALRKDPDQLVRAACAWSLGSINHPGAIADLHKAQGKDVKLVKSQAKRALGHVLSRFPDNLPAVGKGHYKIGIENLKDASSHSGDLAKWLQQYFLDRLKVHDNVDFGTEMNIEWEGENPDVDEVFKPIIYFSLVGRVDKVTTPANRAPGDVKVEITYKLMLDPVAVDAVKAKSISATARFAGGPKPEDAWDEEDDPLFQAQQKALENAVAKAFKPVSRFLKLKR